MAVSRWTLEQGAPNRSFGIRTAASLSSTLLASESSAKFEWLPVENPPTCVSTLSFLHKSELTWTPILPKVTRVGLKFGIGLSQSLLQPREELDSRNRDVSQCVDLRLITLLANLVPLTQAERCSELFGTRTVNVI